MSIDSDSPSTSQHLSSSHASLNPSKKASSELSKTYKHASQLYLQRRLAEAYEAIQPTVRPVQHENGHAASDDEAAPQAPIASATASQRIKIWSLYCVLLKAIIDLGNEDGERQFGRKEWRDIRRFVQSGEVWEQVVRDGYRGREGSVDAEVVYNLSTLVLGHASDQSINQTRLEAYLSASSQPDLDLSTHLHNSFQGNRTPGMKGTSTPRDLASRIKILELFTLHVLPKNDEWDYAQSFISNSDILDEERREAFLQTLQELRDGKEQEADVDQNGYHDAEEELDYRDEQLQTNQEADVRYDAENAVNGTNHLGKPSPGHKRTSSEVDYGIDHAHPNSSADQNGHYHPPGTPNGIKAPPRKDNPMRTLPPDPEPTASPTPTSRPQHLSPPSQPPRHTNGRPTRKPLPKPSSSSSSHSLVAQVRHVIRALSSLASNMAGALTKNPTALFRMLLFVLAFLMVTSRREVRERIRVVVARGWEKVRGTVGMGVKVSYI